MHICITFFVSALVSVCHAAIAFQAYELSVDASKTEPCTSSHIGYSTSSLASSFPTTSTTVSATGSDNTDLGLPTSDNNGYATSLSCEETSPCSRLTSTETVTMTSFSTTIVTAPALNSTIVSSQTDIEGAPSSPVGTAYPTSSISCTYGSGHDNHTLPTLATPYPTDSYASATVTLSLPTVTSSYAESGSVATPTSNATTASNPVSPFMASQNDAERMNVYTFLASLGVLTASTTYWL